MALDNPCAGDIQHAYAFGASKAGVFCVSSSISA